MIICKVWIRIHVNSYFLFRCKMPSDLARHREFHNAVLAYHCDVEGCNFSARSMQTVKRHQKVEHQVRTTVKLHFRDSWLNWTPHYYRQFMDIITDPLIACENIRFSSLFMDGDVSRGGTSATQRQKFHTDDVKSVRNPVRSADWSTE